MMKRLIAHYEQFLILPQSFQMSSATEALESVGMWERLKLSVNNFNV